MLIAIPSVLASASISPVHDLVTPPHSPVRLMLTNGRLLRLRDGQPLIVGLEDDRQNT